ncbi:MAG: DUF2437 domain-containing protein [Thermodesulfobacteriota bacterium]|jgi:hypothetical protein
MRVVRCRCGGQSRCGVLAGETIRLLAGAPCAGLAFTDDTVTLANPVVAHG